MLFFAHVSLTVPYLFSINLEHILHPAGCVVMRPDVAPATNSDIPWSMDPHETDSLDQLLDNVLFTLRLSYALCAGREHSCEALLLIVNFLAMWVMMVFIML